MFKVVNRRRFLGSSAAVAAATLTGNRAQACAAIAGDTQEFYELRTYHFASAGKQQALLEYLGGALLPALKRMGLGRIGVFTALEQPQDRDVRVLIPFPTLEAFAGLTPGLASDDAYRKAAAPHFAAPKTDPAYTRINSQFMKAFSGLPRIELPRQTGAKKARIFELRSYQSHNEDAALRKVEMFNSGEIQAMRDVKLAPVFYGQVLIGQNVPHLTYMLSADDRETHKTHWRAFGAHATWRKLSGMQRYQGLVSKITSWFLKPTDFSQI